MITVPDWLKPALPFFHPVLMWLLLALSGYALYTGIQVIRTRTAKGEEKSRLLKAKFREVHFQVGALLLVLMVWGTLGGMAVTYINNKKLFVGPHLLVGLSMTGLIAFSASLAPLMQQGKDWARALHITINGLVLGLFGWQAVTGMQIVQKILTQG
ncbi:MAG: DUF4079 domain-containing protein [Gloeomargarita sp. SKYBB_i_bin120]|nr:DUF4079 domain-containing protein [Gloeomargarita sp. SKYG98]MCS7292934.1 DUF4079 domain-containing protein [Gloeomargarita sp. SKYB120]MDW8178499.1 DUF4079 domain-containing protein [Gloeomargarita sp. SKYBB_i_bin120]